MSADQTPQWVYKLEAAAKGVGLVVADFINTPANLTNNTLVLVSPTNPIFNFIDQKVPLPIQVDPAVFQDADVLMFYKGAGLTAAGTATTAVSATHTAGSATAGVAGTIAGAVKPPQE